MKRMAWVMLLLGPSVWGAGQMFAQTMTADEIVKRMMERDAQRRAALAHYESQRTYQMDYKGPIGVRHATMRVKVDYSAPDDKQFQVLSESGSTIFCHQVLRKLMEGEQEGAREANRTRSMLSPANDTLKLLGEEIVDGSDAWVIEVSPRQENRFNYQGTVWINKADFAVARIAGTPAKNPTWLIGTSKFDYRYAPQGQFWLPRSNDTSSHLRIGGEITLKVDYGDYQVITAAGANALTPTASRTANISSGDKSAMMRLPQ